METYRHLDFQIITTCGKLCPQVTFVGRVFETRRHIQIFLKIFMPEVKMNFIWTRDTLVCTKQRITQDLLAASQSKPELSGEKQLVFKDIVA